MASQAGFEPATSPLGGARAIQLCHWDVRALYKNTNKNKQLMSSPATTEVQFGPFSADNRRHWMSRSPFHDTCSSSSHWVLWCRSLRIPVKLNSDSGICEHHFRKVCGQGFCEQKLSFEGRHLFDSPNKPAAKRSAAVVDPGHWSMTVHLTSEFVL